VEDVVILDHAHWIHIHILRDETHRHHDPHDRLDLHRVRHRARTDLHVLSGLLALRVRHRHRHRRLLRFLSAVEVRCVQRYIFL